MPYIGKNPVGGGFHKLDALTASATATYALTLNSAAYYPESANQLLVSLGSRNSPISNRLNSQHITQRNNEVDAV